MRVQELVRFNLGWRFLLALLLIPLFGICQSSSHSDQLFSTDEILPVRISYSIKDIKTKTNDSTYLTTNLSYQLPDGSWEQREVKLSARGNNRRETCFFTPIKVKLSKSERQGSIFEGHKKLKLVLPCLVEPEKNDKLLKEYLAYKFYEEIGDHHFKTRLLDIDFKEIRGKKIRSFKLMGFFIEDIDKVADRAGGKELKNRRVHPLQQDDVASIQNDIFQYMIGNTDFSIAYQHNEKLIFTSDKKTVPVPYDFDLSGLVDASYAVVSQVGKQKLPINDVTARLYRGFQRSDITLQQVRSYYLSKKTIIFMEIEKLRPLFDDVQEYSAAVEYIDKFYDIMIDETMFYRSIVNQARTK